MLIENKNNIMPQSIMPQSGLEMMLSEGDEVAILPLAGGWRY